MPAKGCGEGVKFRVDFAQGVFQGVGQFVDFAHGFGRQLTVQNLFKLAIVFREVIDSLLQGFCGFTFEMLHFIAERKGCCRKAGTGQKQNQGLFHGYHL